MKNVSRRELIKTGAIGSVILSAATAIPASVCAEPDNGNTLKNEAFSMDKPLYPAMPIIDRFKGRKIPNVAGIDLEQALNYVDEGGLPLAWFYESYTNPYVFYTQGSRPKLEKLAAEITAGAKSQLEQVRKITGWVLYNVKHNLLTLKCDLAPNRGLTEEQVIESGYGYCNEQARVVAALSQICGMPSRLHFIRKVNAFGHTVCEVMIDGRWAAVCATYNVVFTTPEGLPVNVSDFRRDPKIWDYANACYKEAINKYTKLMLEIQPMDQWPETKHKNRKEVASIEPLEYFERVGYCNYFIH